MSKAARAATVADLQNELARLRQQFEAFRRTQRGHELQDAQREVMAWQALAGSFLALPGLRGLWLASSFDASGNVSDLSGQGRTLTYNGNPTFNYNGLVPYLAFDGTGDYLSRVDEAGLDILGTESYVASAAKGLTLVTWVKFSALGSQAAVCSKGVGGGANTSFWLDKLAGDTVRFLVGDGADLQGPSSTATVGSSDWYFLCGRFTPSSEVALFLDATKYQDTTGIPAALLNTGASLNVGSYNDSGLLALNGQVAAVGLYACTHSDTMVRTLYHQTRSLFRKWG